MENYNPKTKIILTFLIVIFIFAFLFLVLSIWAEKEETPDLDGFAKCLSDKGAVMYGAYWCPHCQNEKNAFGESFKFINYVECTERPNECLAQGINSYPTWIFPDLPAMTSSGEVGRGGRRFVGEQGIIKLSELSSCPWVLR